MPQTGTAERLDLHHRRHRQDDSATPIPNRFDQPQLLFDWVEKNTDPRILGGRHRG
jgi:hypothetical protein